MANFLKSINILKVIERISLAWEQISPDTIRRSWRKLLPIKEIDTTAETEMVSSADFVAQFESLSIEVSAPEVDEWFSMDGAGYEHLDEQWIVDLLNQQDEMDEAVSEDEDDTNVVAEVRKCPVLNAEAMNMLDRCLTWLCWQPEASLANTSTLVQLREMAAVKQEALRIQLTIDTFFMSI